MKPLTEREKSLLERIKQHGPISEGGLHFIYYAATKLTGIDLYGFGDVMDSSEAYSPKLQGIIDSLIEKGYIRRDSNNLLVPKPD